MNWPKVSACRIADLFRMGCAHARHADTTAQKRLRELKARISAQSKKNFVLERDVRYLDSRIALLIQNVSPRGTFSEGEIAC